MRLAVNPVYFIPNRPTLFRTHCRLSFIVHLTAASAPNKTIHSEWPLSRKRPTSIVKLPASVSVVYSGVQFSLRPKVPVQQVLILALDRLIERIPKGYEPACDHTKEIPGQHPITLIVETPQAAGHPITNRRMTWMIYNNCQHFKT